MSYTADRHRRKPRNLATLRANVNHREIQRELNRFGKAGVR